MKVDDRIYAKLEAARTSFNELTASLSDPGLMNDMASYHQVAKKRSELEELVEVFNQYEQALTDIANVQEMIDAEEDEELLALGEEELSLLLEKKEGIEKSLIMLLLPKDPLDDKNIFLEIRAGTGGDEAALFAADLFRMYCKYAEQRKWKVEIMSSSPTGIGGFKEAILFLSGKGCYSHLKFESGVHRVQRVPETEQSGRIHTSTVTVAVLPEVEEVEFELENKDLRIDTFCSSGPGGQSVNTTYSAVRITHVPTGIVATCQDEKSQIKNKAKAMRVLRSRIMEIEREKQNDEIAETRKSQVGSGGRSEKIRTYNFPQNRVSDHRIGLALYKLEAYLEGDMDEMINAMRGYDTSQRISQL